VMAASPPGYRVQFSSAVDDDRCLGPDGLPHPDRVDRNASLASAHVLDYGATLLAELAQRYPGVAGFRIDWPEYPPYDLRSTLFDFSPHAHGALRAAGVDPMAYGQELVERLAGWRVRAKAAAGRGPQAVRDALREGGWDSFFSESGEGEPLWASKRAAVGALLRRYRQGLDSVGGPRRCLEPQVFPAPLTRWSGFNWAALDGTADAVGVKLYTMHWPMIARYWARDLVGGTDGTALDAVTAAMADFMGFCDGEVLPGDQLHYPPPETAHPVGAQAQTAKIARAQTDAGRIPVMAFAHSYGPADDVEHRLRVAGHAIRQAGSGRLWVNRYGYLSDEKLSRLGRLHRGMGGGA
jgi:hypothetical protein